MMQTYRCLKYQAWKGNEYIPGLFYTDRGDEAHKVFGKQAEQWVDEGVFERVEGSSPFHAATGATAHGVATVVKKGA